MPAKAGQIVIDISAGTSKFVVDLEAAKGKLREFGSTGVGEHKAVSAAMKTLEGNFTNNRRAADAFVGMIPGMGTALKAAFPVVGAIAFAGVIGEVGKKVYDFFKEMEDGPKKIASAFRDIQGPLQLTNDTLEITNARLENDIAKLEGKHENTLKVMLLEAQQAADKLAESLEKGLGSLGKLLKEQSVGWVKEAFGQAGTGELEKIFSTLQSAIETVTDQYSEKIAKAVKAGDKGLVKSLTEEEASRISNLYTSAIEKVNAVQQTPPKLLPQSLLVGAPVFEDTTARDEAARRMQKYLQDQMKQSALETQHGELAGRKSGLEVGKEGRDRDQAELIRLTDELAKAQAARLTGLEKIDAEETAEIDHLNEIGEANKANLLVVAQIYDAKRLATYSEEMDKYDKLLGESAVKWESLGLKAYKAIGEFDSDAIKAGKQKLEDYSKALAKVTEPLAKLIAEQDKLAIEHQSRMISLAPGAAANPVATLQLQQAPERAAIAAQYSEQIALANQQLALAQQDNNQQGILLATLQKQRLEAERKLAVDRLDDELAEKQAETRQKGVKDFFREMQGQAQTAGNIFYDAMTSGLDRVSDQLAKLLTGQKTNFGKMLQGLGEEMVKESTKSLMHQGLGKLGDLIFGKKKDVEAHKPTGNPGDAVHVLVDNQPGAPGAPVSAGNFQNLAGLVGAGSSGLAGLLKGLFSAGGAGASSGLTEAVSSSITFMAGGGDVDPGGAYVVGEHEPEFFSPRTAGTITPMSKMRGGGDTHNWNIDARGADLGAANRISRALEATHQSAVATAVRANAQRSWRVPQRAKA
jgi:hypothetical protein